MNSWMKINRWIFSINRTQTTKNVHVDYHISRSKIHRERSSGIEGNPTVFYRLMPGSTAQTNKFHTFYLQQRQDNGDTWADIKVNHPLDYESIKEYNLTIRVEVSEWTWVLPAGELRYFWIFSIRLSIIVKSRLKLMKFRSAFNVDEMLINIAYIYIQIDCLHSLMVENIPLK